MQRKTVFIIIALTSLIPLLAVSGPDELGAIAKRIKPVGEVRIDGAEKPSKTIDVVQEATKLKPGEAVYSKYCAVCHASGLAGAPKIADPKAWNPRIKQRKGLDGLLKSAIKGLNAMPPKGTCASCSDPELKAAIQYMLPAKP